MNQWQPKVAAWRALKTFLQTFSGTGMTITAAISTIKDLNEVLPVIVGLVLAAISSLFAAMMAFAMNLETPMPSGPIEVTGEGGEPVETVEVEDPTPTPVKKSRAKAKK